MLRIWNVVLIITTFGLTIIGTFLTRSGIINSVHSFTQSEIGPAFLVYLALVLIAGFALLFKRIQMLESEYKIESVLCRENVFLAQNILLVGIAFTVLLGTTFPLLAEAVRGTKLSIQAPFFNTITAPMGYALLILMGVGMLISWRRSSLDNLRRNFLSPLIIATLGTLVLFWILFEKTMQWGVYIIFWSTIFVTSTILFEFVKATQIKIKQTGSNIPMGLFYVISKNRRRYGGLIIHFGVVLMFLGFAGSFFSIEKDLTLEAGESNKIGNYRIEFQSVNEFMSDNARHRAAVINVYDFKFEEKIIQKNLKFKPSDEVIIENEDLIIDDNENFIVVNKESGIAVQGGTKSKKNLIDIFSKSKIFENTKPYLSLIHI